MCVRNLYCLQHHLTAYAHAHAHAPDAPVKDELDLAALPPAMTQLLMERMRVFASCVIGAPYGFKLSQLLPIRSTSSGKNRATSSSEERRSSSSHLSDLPSTLWQCISCTIPRFCMGSDEAVAGAGAGGDSVHDPSSARSSLNASQNPLTRSEVEMHSPPSSPRDPVAIHTSSPETETETDTVVAGPLIPSTSASSSDQKKANGDDDGADDNGEDGEEVKDDDYDGEGGPASASQSKDKYFCSELVAALLQNVGVIAADLNPTSFWPGSFAKGNYIDLCCEDTSFRFG